MPRKPSRPPVLCEFFAWRLFKRDGVFYADGRTGQHDLGKHSLASRDSEEALANLRRLDRQMAVERGLAAPASANTSSDLPIADGWALYLADCERPQVAKGVSAKTRKRYRAVQDKHVTFCRRHGPHTWTQFTDDHAKAYGSFLEKEGYADRSIYLELTLIKSVVHLLIEKGKLPATARLTFKMGKPEGTDVYCYSFEQVKAMVAHCRADPSLHWLGDVIVALACTGLRISELASLRWTDIDLRAQSLQLTDERAGRRQKGRKSGRQLKGRRGRSLAIHADLYDMLLGMSRHADGRVFHGQRGAKLKPDTVRNVLVRDVIEPLKGQFPTPPEGLGFEHGRVHGLRHYFCTQAFRGGASEAQIKEWLGHADSEMVAHYRHLSDEDGRRQMQRLDFVGRKDRKRRSLG